MSTLRQYYPHVALITRPETGSLSKVHPVISEILGNRLAGLDLPYDDRSSSLLGIVAGLFVRWSYVEILIIPTSENEVTQGSTTLQHFLPFQAKPLFQSSTMPGSSVASSTAAATTCSSRPDTPHNPACSIITGSLVNIG